MRPKFALKNFRRNVGRLKSDAKETEAFYAGLSQAILDYFGDRWERSGQGISLDMIRERFEKAGIADELYQRLVECIETCDLARFTPTTSSSREQLQEKVIQTITEIEGALS